MGVILDIFFPYFPSENDRVLSTFQLPVFLLYSFSIDHQENALGYNRKYTIDTDTRPFFY